ncbi:MAG: NADH-quinone oxidoreductase subunit J [Bryocella sp.]
MHLALFLIFGILAVAAALNLLFQRHPINSALSLVVVMVSLAVLYWTLGAEFLAAAQVIVYAGAVMVLFVFVVMLLNAGEEETSSGSRIAYIAGIPGALGVLGLIGYTLLRNRAAMGTISMGDHMQSGMAQNLTDVARELFTNLLLPFEATSILVLVAILGAVVLARKEL